MRKHVLIGMAILLIVSCKNEKKESRQNGEDSPAADEISDTQEEENIEFTCVSGVFGIDISDNDTITDWQEVGRSGISFIYIKATDGIRFNKAPFDEQWEQINIANASIVRGAYHFFEYSRADRTGQAKFYIKTVLRKYQLAGSTLPPVIDLEYRYDEVTKKRIPIPNKAIFQQEVINWLRVVETAFGRKPIIYVDIDFANSNLDLEEFGNYPIWVANYKNGSAPDLPVAWRGKRWVFWQKQPDLYPVRGIKNLVDFDCFNGTQEGLSAL